jgi:hypothetical protein
VVWGAGPHCECGAAFGDIAADPQNSIVILTGSGEEFIAREEIAHPAMSTPGGRGAAALPTIAGNAVMLRPGPHDLRVAALSANTIQVKALKRESLSLHWELTFTRSLYQTPDRAAQGRLLNEVAALVDAGRLHTAVTRTLREAHALFRDRAHPRQDHACRFGLSGARKPRACRIG